MALSNSLKQNFIKKMRRKVKKLRQLQLGPTVQQNCFYWRKAQDAWASTDLFGNRDLLYMAFQKML